MSEFYLNRFPRTSAEEKAAWKLLRVADVGTLYSHICHANYLHASTDYFDIVLAHLPTDDENYDMLVYYTREAKTSFERMLAANKAATDLAAINLMEAIKEFNEVRNGIQNDPRDRKKILKEECRIADAQDGDAENETNRTTKAFDT